MEKIIVEVWSDYVCPFCYLEEPVLNQIAREEDAEIRWRAFELRPEPKPALDPRGEYLQHIWKTAVYPMAEQRGVRLRLPPVQPRSRNAAEAAEFARAKGRFDEMHLALFKAFFEDGRDIGKINVLLEIGDSIGLNVPQLLGSLEVHEFRPKVLADEKLARRLEITGVPTMVIHRADTPPEDGLRITGAQPVEVLRHAVHRLRQRLAVR